MINILLVEDNLGFRDLFRAMLAESSLKFNLFEADNPIEGLETFTKNHHNFDYIISDFFLPIQNGNDFLEVVKMHKTTIQCILISADSCFESKHYEYVDHYFNKSDAQSLVKYIATHSFLG